MYIEPPQVSFSIVTNGGPLVTSPDTGVEVVTRLNTKEYQTRLKMSKDRIGKTKIRPHPQIPDLNYRIIA